MKSAVLVHYHEIGLKGKNRIFFEKKLVENIKRALSSLRYSNVVRIPGRILIQGIEEQQFSQLKSKLSKVFGIIDFSLVYQSEKNFEKIKKTTLQLIKPPSVQSFKVETKRADKNFSLTSCQVNEKIGEAIVKKFKLKVDLDNPQLIVFIEIAPYKAFIYFEKIKGPGGLPVTTAGKVVSLLSGGIDSPLAAYRLMKRGAKIVFLHFHSYPKTDKVSIEKAKEIVRVLSQYQFSSKLYLIPFLAIQKRILFDAPEKFRVILYRRFMFKIAEKIAQKEKALGIVTGESLGQVASQTLENIKVIEEGISLPIFRPLIGEDKQEIINQAKEIGTYKLSILPHQDCCSLFIPRHPATKAKLEEVLKAEEKLKTQALIKETLKKIKIEKLP